jgi:hypothetical protein
MAKRLNDTDAAKVAHRGGGPQYSSVTKSLRKIDNGYLHCEYKGDGTSREYFSPHPETPAGADHGPAETRNSLREAADYLKGSKI